VRGWPSRISDPYRVLLPDSTEVVYEPGDDGYFDQVLIDLSRCFAIGERGEREHADVSTITELMAEKVSAPSTAMRRGRYGSAPAGEPAEREPGEVFVRAVSQIAVYHSVEDREEIAIAARAVGAVPYVAA
jgi:hypothetical protein